ncbi:MAG: class I SAM-dependent methyltransferase [Cyclobacteriaceae bacterium]
MGRVSEFYDEFTRLQLKSGINHRHLSIQRHLEKIGLMPNSKVLEVGCGIGTVSELILRFLSKEGALTATDISPKSLEIARKKLAKYANVIIREIDLTTQEIDGDFDLIVLPDVIEHIPIDKHKSLFAKLSIRLKFGGCVFIHIPDPNHLEWTIKHNPTELQIIDQPIHTHILSANLLDTGLYIHHLESYSIYNNAPDYQAIVLKHIPKKSDYSTRNRFLHDSMIRRLKRKVKYVIRGNK